MNNIFLLLIAFQLKHFICDYPLQGTYMLGKLNKQGWFLPLLAHSLVHSVGTFIVAFIFTKAIIISLLLALADLVLHFIVDRLKVISSYKYTIQTTQFWWALGLDQMAHHLINYGFIFIIIIYTIT